MKIKDYDGIITDILNKTKRNDNNYHEQENPQIAQSISSPLPLQNKAVIDNHIKIPYQKHLYTRKQLQKRPSNCNNNPMETHINHTKTFTFKLNLAVNNLSAKNTPITHIPTHVPKIKISLSNQLPDYDNSAYRLQKKNTLSEKRNQVLLERSNTNSDLNTTWKDSFAGFEQLSKELREIEIGLGQYHNGNKIMNNDIIVKSSSNKVFNQIRLRMKDRTIKKVQ